MSVPTYKTNDNENFFGGNNPPGDAINHIVWQGLPGVYIAAANGGLLKTVDYGLNWDFLRPATIQTGLYTSVTTTWPGGALGRQAAFAIGPKVCPTPGGILLMTEGPGDNVTIYKRQGGIWGVQTAFIPSPSFTESFGDTIQKAGGFHFASFNGDLWRSGDGGATWVFTGVELSLGIEPMNMSEGPDGSIYVMAFGAGTDDIYQSTDGGMTWNIIEAFGGGSNMDGGDSVQTAADADHVYYVGSPGGFGISPPYISIDGGGATAIPHAYSDVSLFEHKIFGIAPSGRLLLMRDTENFIGPYSNWYMTIHYSDNQGVSWTEVQVLVNPSPSPEGEIACDPGFGPLLVHNGVVFACGNICKFFGDAIYVWMSLDEGETWQLLEPLGNPGWDNESTSVSSNAEGRIIYDPIEDVLYASSFAAASVLGVFAMTNPKSGTSSWVDVTPFGAGEYPVGGQALALA